MMIGSNNYKALQSKKAYAMALVSCSQEQFDTDKDIMLVQALYKAIMGWFHHPVTTRVKYETLVAHTIKQYKKTESYL